MNVNQPRLHEIHALSECYDKDTNLLLTGPKRTEECNIDSNFLCKRKSLQRG